MGVKPVALTPTYGAQSGNVAMSLLDGTKQAEEDAFNDVATYANYFLDVGAVNALAITTTPLGFTLAQGVQFDVLVAATNTGAVTMNVNATGAIPVTDASGVAMGAGTLIANTIYNFIYDGTAFRASGTAAGGGTGPGSFTTLAVSGTISGAGVNALFASPPADIGSVAARPGFFTNLSVTGVGSYIALQTMRNLAIVPVAGTGLSVRAASGAHSTQIADTANVLFNAGYLSLPVSGHSTADISDRGKCIFTSGGNITIPVGVFAQGDAFCIFNTAATPLSIISSLTGVRLAGTNTAGSPRTLSGFGLATVLFYAANGIAISGAGVS